MLRLWIPIVPGAHLEQDPGRQGRQRSTPSRRSSAPAPSRRSRSRRARTSASPPTRTTGRAPPRSTRSIFEIYTNQDTMAMDLKSGAIDVAVGLPAAQFDALKNEPGITAKAAALPLLRRAGHERLRQRRLAGEPRAARPRVPPGDQLGGRQAEDRRHLPSAATPTVGQSIIGPFTDDAWTPTPEETFGYDLAKAKQLLDEAGYTDADGDGVREDKQGKPIELRLWTRSESPEQQRAGKLIAGSFEELGLKHRPQRRERRHDQRRHLRPTRATPTPRTSTCSSGAGAATSIPGYQLGVLHHRPDRVVERLLLVRTPSTTACTTQQDAEMDPATREEQVQRMQQIFYERRALRRALLPARHLIAYNTDKWEGWVPYPGEERPGRAAERQHRHLRAGAPEDGGDARRPAAPRARCGSSSAPWSPSS